MDIVQVAFGNEVWLGPSGAFPVNGLGKFFEKSPGTEVIYPLQGIEPQRVDVIMDQPIERILYKEVPDLIAQGPIEIHRIAPWCPIPVGEIRSKPVEVIPFRPQVVVNDVQDNGQSI